MKKRWLFAIIVGFLICFVLNIDENINEETRSFKNKRDNSLSIMLETEANSGVYEKSSSSDWPTEGYKFNQELSKCDNGGELSWDKDKKMVIMASDSANKCYVYFDVSAQYLSDYVISQFTGVQGENAIYYHNSSLSNGASDNSYRYAGADYVMTDKAKNAGYTSVLSGRWLNDSVNLIGIYCKGTENAYVLYSCSSDDYYYKVKYDTTTEFTTYHEVMQKAYSDGYIDYNVKNFVCFGSDEVPCPTDNLYRIIGVFEDSYHKVSGKKLVKLIKWDYVTDNILGTNGDYNASYAFGILEDVYRGVESDDNLSKYNWNHDEFFWNDSKLYSVNLNTNYINYLNNINIKWSNMVETITWQVSGDNASYSGNIAASYKNEIVNPHTSDLINRNVPYEVNAKIGLMYVSDYGFAASPSRWTSKAEDYNYAVADNWMYMGGYEWMITRDFNNFGDAYFIWWRGDTDTESMGSKSYLVRTTFLLKETTKYESGIGTMEDPIRLAE